MNESENYNEKLHLGATGKLYQYSRELRLSQTKAEIILWEQLRNRKFNGLKFRRQHPLDKFIADFYCHEKRLVIELDGAAHRDHLNKQYDEARTYELSGSGLMVLRFWNRQVEENLDIVLKRIQEACNG